MRVYSDSSCICFFTNYFCSFFSSFIQIEPPFKPQVTSETDTRYFDQEFTGESVQLTPPDQGTLDSISEEQEHVYFQQFSYHGSSALGSSVLGKSMDQM